MATGVVTKAGYNKYYGNIFAVRNLLYYVGLYLNLIICLFTTSVYDVDVKDIFNNIKNLFSRNRIYYVLQI